MRIAKFNFIQVFFESLLSEKKVNYIKVPSRQIDLDFLIKAISHSFTHTEKISQIQMQSTFSDARTHGLECSIYFDQTLYISNLHTLRLKQKKLVLIDLFSSEFKR